LITITLAAEPTWISASWDAISEGFKNFGVTKTLFTLFFLAAHWYLRSLYTANMKNKQEEINRMAEHLKAMREENKELREELRKIYKSSSSVPKTTASKK
jgi:cell shape-determining protein MreC